MITKDSHILITGDSWGLGEWDTYDGQYGNVHRGLEQYLKDYGCSNVTNVSWGGFSNCAAYETIRERNLTPDIIFWFQTDPIRDLRPYDNYVIHSYHQLIDDHIRLIDSAYNRFNNLNIPVYVIGGCSKVNVDIIKRYSNLTALIPSTIELLTTSKHPNFWCTDWAHTVSEKIDRRSLDLLFEELNNPPIQLRRLHSRYYWPDGCHLNRHGHRKIFEYIIEKFNL